MDGWYLLVQSKTYGKEQDSDMFIDTQSSQSFMTEIYEFVSVEESLPHASIDELWKLETIGNIALAKKKYGQGVLEHLNNIVTKDNKSLSSYIALKKWR